MGYKITLPNGTLIEADSLEEFSRALSEIGVGPNPSAIPNFADPTVRAQVTAAQLHMFLEALEEAGKPIPSKDLAALAGLKGPRALAGAMVTWRKILLSIGFNQEEVARNVRESGVNQWIPGPKLGDAVRELEKHKPK